MALGPFHGVGSWRSRDFVPGPLRVADLRTDLVNLSDTLTNYITGVSVVSHDHYQRGIGAPNNKQKIGKV